MQIVIKFPEEYRGTDVQPFLNGEPETTIPKKEREKMCNIALNTYKKINKIGYRVSSNSPLISIEKKDGCLYLEIDEREAVSIERMDGSPLLSCENCGGKCCMCEACHSEKIVQDIEE